MYPPRRSFPIDTSLANASHDDITGYIGTPSGQIVAAVNPITGQVFPVNRVNPRAFPVAWPDGRPDEIDVEGLDGVVTRGANPFRDALVDMIGVTPVGTETGFGDGRIDLGELGVSFDASGGAWAPGLRPGGMTFSDTELVGYDPSAGGTWWLMIDEQPQRGAHVKQKPGWHHKDRNGVWDVERDTPPPGWIVGGPNPQPGSSTQANIPAPAQGGHLWGLSDLNSSAEAVRKALGLRPDPSDTGLPARVVLSRGEMHRLVSQVTAPPWQSDLPVDEGFVSTVDVDWDMVRGGGYTDPVPYGDGALRGRVAVSRSIYQSPASDGPEWSR